MATTALVPVSGEVITAPKHPGGRPTDYRPEYCQQLLDYFMGAAADREPDKILRSKSTSASGESESYQLLPKTLPTLARFAVNLKVTRDTLNEWGKRHPEFSAALSRAKEIGESVLVEDAAKGLIPPATFAFIATNYTSMRARTEVVSTNAADSRVVELLRAMPAATRNTVIEALRAAEAKLAEAGQGAIESGPGVTEGT